MKIRTPSRRTKDEPYDHNKYMAARQRDKTAQKQDIGEIPAVKNWKRRNACRKSLVKFLTTYLIRQFYLGFSDDHLTTIKKAEQAVLKEGLFACAMPRGSGKTELTKGTAVWAILYGHRRFPLLVGPTATAAEELLEGIKFFFESPDLFPFLLEDFPEAIFPITKLEGETRRAIGQRCCGERTEISWGKNFIVMPSVPPGNWIDGKKLGSSPSGGATIRVTGITGRIRGFNIKGVRPDLVIPDDPQTDESAFSRVSNAKIERTLATAVIGLAGPGKKIAGIMPCTVIAKGDAIDNVLTHDLHPEWDSCRTKLLYSFPEKLEHWEKYRDTKNRYDPGIEGDKIRAGKEATEYYQANQVEMKLGSKIAWKERFDPKTELDALQHAMNLFFQDKFAFFSEYQNDPLLGGIGENRLVGAEAISAKLSNLPQRSVPALATHLCLGIDVQQHLLFWTVSAFRASDFSGWVVDYGTWPEQGSLYFRYADITKTIERVTGLDGEAATLHALRSLTKELMDRDWLYGEDKRIQIGQAVVDCGWSSEVVQSFCQELPYKGRILPSFGKGVGAKMQPMSMWARQPGEIRQQGCEWLNRVGKIGRYLLFDTNHWKTFFQRRLRAAPAAPGSLTLFGNEPRAHRMFADHLSSEVPTAVSANGRTIDEWALKPNADNHYLDSTILSLLAASVQGVGLAEVARPQERATLPPLAELRRQAMERAANATR